MSDKPENPLIFDGLYRREGMTLRDYFAAAALQGMYGGRLVPIDSRQIKDDATFAYSVADAMLEARKAGES